MNRGSEPATFRVSFTRLRMKADGSFEEVAEPVPGERFADPLIRYSPRQVTLPPGQSQVVRLMLRKPRDLEDGEYRSHLLFQALPPATSSSIENIAADAPAEGITVQITPLVGVSIPVIVRHGELDSAVTLSDAQIVAGADGRPGSIPTNASSEGRPVVAVTLNRSGSGSVYGDFRVTFTPAGGEPLVVAQANGVAVYANLDRRQFRSPLSLPAGIELANGSLDIAYIAAGEDPASATLARTALTLD